MGRAKAVVFGFVLSAGLAAVTLVLLEVSLRLSGFDERWRFGPYKAVLDNRVLFRLTPDPDYNVSSQGFRCPPFSAEALKVRTTVAVLGDSFVFGSNVTIEHTLPFLLQQRLGKPYAVLNFGVFGYGPDQSLMQWTDIVAPLRPAWVVLCVYPGNDFNDLAKNQLFVLSSTGALIANENHIVRQMSSRWYVGKLFHSWRLIWLLKTHPGRIPINAARGPSYERLHEQLMADSFDRDLLEHPENAVSVTKRRLMEAILARFKAETARAGSRFVVVVIPSMFAVRARNFSLERNLEEIARKQGIAVVNLVPRFKNGLEQGLYDPVDGHFSPQGYRIAAETVARAISAP